MGRAIEAARVFVKLVDDRRLVREMEMRKDPSYPVWQ